MATKAKGKKAKKVLKSTLIMDPAPPKPLKATTDPEELAKRLAVAVNRVAFKKGEVGFGWVSYMRVAFFQLLKQGYTVTDPKGKEIEAVTPPEAPPQRKVVAEVALLFYAEDYIVTPLGPKDDKLVQKWLKDRCVPHTAKINKKKTQYWIPHNVWEPLTLDRDLRRNRGADYWLLEGWTCKGK